jgi:G3E family GTPase
MKKKIYFINGALGSGKTTLVNQVLDSGSFQKTFIIENEISTFSIDHNCMPVNTKDIKVLAGECICCSDPKELSNILHSLKEKDYQNIIIESSGVASLNELLIKILSDESLEDIYEIAGCVFVVDAAGLERTNLNDLEIADFVIVTKFDLLNNFEKQKDFDKFIKEEFSHINFNIKNNIHDDFWIEKLLSQKSKTFREWSLSVNDSSFHGDNFTEIIFENLDKINWSEKYKKMNECKILRIKGFYKKEGQTFHIEATPEQFKENIEEKNISTFGVVVIGKNKILLDEFIKNNN